jgi:hypothetical protein
MDFHGDGVESEVEIVTPNGLLRNRDEAASQQHRCDLILEPAHDAAGSLQCFGSCFQRPLDTFARNSAATGGGIGGGTEEPALLNGCVAKPILTCFAVGPQLDSVLDQQRSDIDSILSAEGRCGLAFPVTFQNVVDVHVEAYSGHVYNLQTESGWYIASGVVSHNCYNFNAKTTSVVRYPKAGEGKYTTANPGDAADQKWHVCTVSGPMSTTMLREIARNVFEQRNRKELTVSFSTVDLASYGGSNLRCDVLEMQPGDPFQLHVAMQDIQGNQATAAGTAERLNIRVGDRVLQRIFGTAP